MTVPRLMVAGATNMLEDMIGKQQCKGDGKGNNKSAFSLAVEQLEKNKKINNQPQKQRKQVQSVVENCMDVLMLMGMGFIWDKTMGMGFIWDKTTRVGQQAQRGRVDNVHCQ